MGVVVEVMQTIMAMVVEEEEVVQVETTHTTIV